MFNDVKRRIRSDRMNGCIQKVPFRWLDFLYGPVGITDVFLGSELAVLICIIDVSQLTAFVNAVLGAGQRSVTLRLACFRIRLCSRYGEFLSALWKLRPAT